MLPARRYHLNGPLAIALLLTIACALPARAAGQSDAGQSATPNADTSAPKAEAPKSSAGPDAPKLGEPTDPKARKTYAAALDWEKHKYYNEALENFQKANKQDGGRCFECLRRANTLAVKLDAYKDAVQICRELLPLAQTDKDKANVHFRLASALQVEGIREKKDQYFQESNSEFKAALDLDPKMARARYHWGITLAHLHQDDAARAQFSQFLDEDRNNPSLHERAERFQDRIDLARATMAPPFMVTTLDGQQISMDSLAGKVVLIDFWATWCGPCREALPRMQHIARKFDGQPLVLLSISVDKDEAKWKEFVDKNKMTWLQVRDGGSNGDISKKFSVEAIPATFSIDADGVLEDQHVGDAEIEGKLKKMVARAVEMNNKEMNNKKPAPAIADAPAGSGN